MTSYARFQLTNHELQYSSKYEDPRHKQVPVLRRFYYNELSITPTRNTDTSTMQISRRARTVELTFSGDIDKFNLEISDVTGEQYTVGPTHIPLLVSGYGNDPKSDVAPPVNLTNLKAFLPDSDMGPYTFEPNIVTRPNQTLQFTVTSALAAPTSFVFLLGIVAHVVEFPGMPGSPR